MTQKRIDDAKANLANMLEDLGRSFEHEDKPPASTDQEGDVKMDDGETKTDAVTGEVVTIPLSGEDELADIPAEMRETVAKEIAAFRDRSNRRDLDRLKREEEQEKSNSFSNYANARLRNAEAGPGVQGAPTGPKGHQGSQIPRDYQKGVTFVNGTGIQGLNQADEDSDASDEELERRRIAKRDEEANKAFLDQERRWLNRERSRAAALEREKKRDDEEEANADKEKVIVAKRLKEWDDDVEASRKVEEYYADRGKWLRNRAIFREREEMEDHQDRMMEEREKAREREKQERARGAAEDFLARQAQEMEARAEPSREPQRFKMSLGAAAQKAQAGQRRTVAEAEVLLEDEDDADTAAKKRTLVPLNLEGISDTAGLSDEERQSAVKQLASEIPSDKDGLWKWDVKWDFVDDSIVADQLRPFVEKKIVEYLGVQEQMLVDVVEEHIKKRGKPQDLVGELEGVSEMVLCLSYKSSTNI